MVSKSIHEIATLFLSYFEEKAHKVVPSSSLIPAGDPTLLFTTAGMVQFKPLFTGAVDLPYTRAASCQKCLRTTDLENVGKTERHCTFFEMLGNFSFGDYFKEDAIRYALEFSLDKLQIPKEKIWVTIYLDDDEAKSIWMQNGIPENRIVRLGKKDNFWGPAGDSGACGPCTELYLDRGKEKGFAGCGDKASCVPGCDCDRFLEYWNLVFNQFNQTVTGELQPLKQTGIDTGSGVERIALLLQEVDSVYDTDEFQVILKSIADFSGKVYAEDTKQAFRVIADHSRSTFFSLHDHIYPDKTGRGYVIRRLLRRAALFARKLGMTEPFLYKLVPVLESIYQKRYPEITKRGKEVALIIQKEEELFLHTLEIGLETLERYTKDLETKQTKTFPGDFIFKLYSTYGFPSEMTKELVEEKGFSFDEKGFLEELEKDRNLSRSSWKGKKQSFLTGISDTQGLKTQFVGYKQKESKGKILYLFSDGISVPELKPGMRGIVVLDSTPFYAEGGGQIGDQGFMKGAYSQFQVLDTQKENDTHLHFGEVLKGTLQVGDEIHSTIEEETRQRIANHHSGTHLLNGALRRVLGSHVMQKGSIVTADYLRFDFSHNAPMTEDEILQVEKDVNQAIAESVAVVTEVLPIEQAKNSGALSMFDEKYGAQVRVVSMGKFSKEFCGGTHVQTTKDIQQFTIVRESSPGAGTRRIEAICGPMVVSYFQTEFQNLESKIQESNARAKDLENPKLLVSEVLPSPEDVASSFLNLGQNAVFGFKTLRKKVLQILEEVKSEIYKFQKEKEKQSFQGNQDLIESLLESKVIRNGISLVTKAFQDVEAQSLKELGDTLKSRDTNLIALFASKTGDNITLVFLSHPSVTSKGFHAGNLLKNVLANFSGKGGGRPDMAQGGGKLTASPEEILQFAWKELEKEGKV